jgi:hypothetical protein
MTFNRSLFIVGLLIALIGGGAVFAINFLFAPLPEHIVAAARDLPAGTVLAELPEDALVILPVQFSSPAARRLLQGVVGPEDLEQLRASGALLIQDVYQDQPLVQGAIVAADHPAAGRIPRLGLADPDWMILFIPATQSLPAGIRVGDRIDLALAVEQVPDPLALTQTHASAPAHAAPITQSTWQELDPQALILLLTEAGYAVQPPEDVLPAAGEQPTSTPTATPTPTPPPLREPISKLLVSGARVTHIHREQNLAGFGAAGDPELVEGAVLGLDVLVPRASLEYLTMAIHSGRLQIGLLSPLAGEQDGPTLGASLQDLLDRYQRDRELLLPSPTPQP